MSKIATDHLNSDLFKEYNPKKLLDGKIIDCRFLRVNGWSIHQAQLKHQNLYPVEIKNLLNLHINISIAYLEGQSILDLSQDTQISITTIKNVAKSILSDKNIDDILKLIISYEGKLGLDYSIVQMKVFFSEKQILPTISDFPQISGAIARGNWENFGVRKWNELLLLVFGKINKIQGDYLSADSLNQIKEKLLNLKVKTGKIPKARDKEVKAIVEALRREVFKNQGIQKWNDLLKFSFNEINLLRNQFSGVESFQTAVDFLKEFNKREHRLPTTKDQRMACILGALERKEWETFGINTWNDLLIKVFGEVNLIQGYYSKEEGLERAIIELRRFKETFGRLPKYEDHVIQPITAAIGHGNWKSFGIKTWNDLLRYVFKETNDLIKIKKYIGKEGLERAKYDLVSFKQKYKRLPKSRDKEIIKIIMTLQRGEWEIFGIKTLNDLLNLAFGTVNKTQNIYKGKKGLEIAKSKLLEFEKQYNRKPTYKDKNFGLSGVFKAFQRCEWKEFGITKFNDLLLYSFGEVNTIRNEYIGRTGLDLAINKIKIFYKDNKRKPNNKDKGMRGIVTAIRRHEWSGFGISSWQYLLKIIFPNR